MGQYKQTKNSKIPLSFFVDLLHLGLGPALNGFYGEVDVSSRL